MSQLANPFPNGLNQGMGIPQVRDPFKTRSKPPVHFQDIPGITQWRSACYGRWYTSTKHDKLLMDMESIIKQYPRIKTFYLRNRQENTFPLVKALSQLFDLSTKWVQQNNILTAKTKPRSPAIEGLRNCSASILRKLFGIRNPQEIGQINQKLKGFLTKPMSDHGRKMDAASKDSCAPLVYMNDTELDSKKIHWRGGIAYQQSMAGHNASMQPLDTSRWINLHMRNAAHTGRENNGRMGVAGYAVSYEKVFYAAQHPCSPSGRYFHSSYLSGRPVLCAGAMTFVKGKLTYINNASGHYKPEPRQLVMALEALKLYDVPLNDVVVDVLMDKDDLMFKKYSYKSFLSKFRGF